MSNILNQTQAAAAAPVGHMSSVGTGQTDQGRAKVMQIQLKEVAIVVSALLVIGGLVGGYWLYTQQEESQAGGTIIFSKDAKPAVTLNAQPAVTGPVGKGVSVSTTIPGLVPASKTTDSIHADIYFDFDRSRLNADGVATLQEKAAVLKKDGSWAVLVQGYADQYGPAAYNKTLAARRAGAVKQFLVELGIPETSIKVVTLGKEGAICDDQSKECQRLNRRVHLEMMKLDLSAAAPALLTPAVTNQQQQNSGVGVSTSFTSDAELAEDQDLADQDEASVLRKETETSSTTR